MYRDKSYDRELKRKIVLSWIVTIFIALIIITVFILDFIFWNNIVIKIIGCIGTVMTVISAIITLKKTISKEER